MDPGPDWRVVAGWTLGVALALALLGLAWRWWRRRARRRPSPQPAVTAERAIAAIRALAAVPARSDEDTLASYRRLSDALRAYLGLPLDVPAVALTSTEIVRAVDDLSGRGPRRPGGARQGLRPRPSAVAERHDRTRALLEHVDQVKFVGARPPDGTRADTCGRAIALIEDLERGRVAGAEAPRDVA